jgi:hypothetical protein
MTRGAWLLAAACWGAGCSSYPHQDAAESWRPVATALGSSVALPSSYRRVAVAPVQVWSTSVELGAPPPALVGAPGDGAPVGADRGDSDRMEIDERAVREALADMLRATGRFDPVLVEDASPFAASEPPPLTLDVRLTEATLERDEAGDSAVAAWAAYLFLGWFADWYHDHTYVMTANAELSLRETGAARALARARGDSLQAESRFSLLERRPEALPVLATVLFCPYFVFDSDAAAVTRLLSPLVLRAPLAELLEELAQPRSRYRLVMRKRLRLTSIELEVVSPQVGALMLDSVTDLKLRVKAAPALGELESVQLGSVEVKVRGQEAVASFRDVALDTDQGLPIIVHAGGRKPMLVGELSVTKTASEGGKDRSAP